MGKESFWYDYPQKINYWDIDIDYVMFVDENGNEGRVNDVLKKITNNEEVDINNRYFTITGCIFKKEDYLKSKYEFEELKAKYWENGLYYDDKAKGNKCVCFHSREIRRRDKAFSDKLIDNSLFLKDLTIVLSNTKCKIISVTIDLVSYLKSGCFQSIYEKAFDILLERYIYITKNGKKSIMMLEARGKEEDKKLLKHICDIVFKEERNDIKSKLVGVYFNPKWSKEYDSTYLGLEITDLFSYPIHQYIKYNKESPAFEVLKTKIDGYPNYNNKGLKIFPLL